MLQLVPLFNLNRRMSGLGSVPEMQQLLIFVKKMRVTSKMNSHYKLNHQPRANEQGSESGGGEAAVLVMLINFIWMKICCFRLVCNFVFPYLHY
jgi:hypothetical protein